MTQETRKVEVWLRVNVLCEVTVKRPNADGQAEITAIGLAQRGNFMTPSEIESSGLEETEYEAIDYEAVKAWTDS